MGGILGKITFDADEPLAGRRNHAHRSWSLLMLEFWFREFIDGDAAEEGPAEYASVRAA